MFIKRIIRKNNVYLFLGVSTIFALYEFINLVFGLDPFFGDFTIYYNEAQMFWNRINPIGEIGGAFPYAYVLNVFYVLPIKMIYAKTYGFILFCIILFVFGFYIYSWNKKYLKKDKKIIITISIFEFLAMFPWSVALPYGNIGTICCICAVLSIFYCNKNKLLSSILLVIALIKPHATGTILIYYLFVKEYKILYYTIFILLISYIGSSLWLGIYPLHLLYMVFNNSATGALSCQSMGVASFLYIFGMKKTTIYFFSILVSLLYCLVLFSCIKIKGINNKWIRLVPFCVSATTWYYLNPPDEYILIIPVLVYVYYISVYNSKLFKCNLIEGIVLVTTSMGAVGCSYVIRLILKCLFNLESQALYYLYESIFHILILFGSFYFVLKYGCNGKE